MKTSTYQHLYALFFTCFLISWVVNTNATILFNDSICSVNINIQGIDAQCYDEASGVAAAVAKGGIGSYSFTWSDGQSEEIAVGLSAGTYMVTVVDSVGCSDSATIVIGEPSPLTIFAQSSTPASCFNVCDGTATVVAAGGTPPYSYTWSNNTGGQTSPAATDLCAGTYYVTAMDNHGCKIVDTVVVTNNPTLEVDVMVTDLKCFEGSDGQMIAIGNGGSPPYSYEWNSEVNGQTTATVTGLSAGTYTLTITDSIGCYIIDSPLIIIQPSELINTISSSDISCYGFDDGSAAVVVLGGTPPYSYTWSNGDTTSSISGLSAGSYSVTVADSNSCLVIDSIIIEEPSEIILSLNGNDATCYELGDGSIDLTVSGGVPPYMIELSGNVNISGGPIPGPNFTISGVGITAGIYTVKVIDADSCMKSAQVTIDEPPPVIALLTKTDVSCYGENDGTVTLHISGGIGSGYRFKYNLNGGIKSGGIGYTSPVTGIKMAPGLYGVSVADGNWFLGKQGCFDTAYIRVYEPAELIGVINCTDISCYGDMDGSSSVVVTGGIPPYSYSWSNGDTTSSISGLGSGTYSVTVTDSAGCMFIDSCSVIEPPELTLEIVSQNISCYGSGDGMLQCIVNGGSFPYKFIWSSGDTTAIIVNPAPGEYTVVVIDSNGCLDSLSAIISEPVPFSLDTDSKDMSCSNICDGSVIAIGEGGIPPYSYSWNNGFTGTSQTGLCAGVYTVIAVDSNGCADTASLVVNEPDKIKIGLMTQNVSCPDDCDGVINVVASGGTGDLSYMWTTGDTTSTITGLCAGKYIVTITDENLCYEKISISILSPPAMIISIDSLDVSCYGGNDGEAYVSVTGGKTPYKYVWSHSAMNNDTITGLTAGSYGVKVVDGNGCSDSISFVINEPDSINVSTVATDVTCYNECDGSIAIMVSGGNPPYSYLWSDGSMADTATGLCTGAHSVTVTDQSGCTVSIIDTIGEPFQLVYNRNFVNVSCYGANDAGAVITAGGGTPPYTNLWSNGSMDSTILFVGPGTYSVTITDANGCDTSVSITIGEPDPISLITSSTPVSCYGGSDGTATANVSGGNVGPGYTYIWSDGQTTSTATGLSAGVYSVTVTDFGAPNIFGDTTYCSDSTTIVVEQSDSITISISSTPVSCYNGDDGTATAIASGGAPPYTYLWDNFDTTTTITGLSPGTYFVIVVDTNGCFRDTSIALTNPPEIILDIEGVNVSCNAAMDGSSTVFASGGTPPYEYQWDSTTGGQTTSTATGLSGGTYYVTVTDSSGCMADTSIALIESPQIIITVNPASVPCYGDCNATLTAIVGGGIPPYSYQWDTTAGSQTGVSATGLCAGIYQVTVTDDNGCTALALSTVTQPDSLIASLFGDTIVSCFDSCDASLTLIASGGTGPYMLEWYNSAGLIISGPFGSVYTLDDLCADNYTIVVEDINGCTDTLEATILDPDPLIVVATHDTVCYDQCDGSISVTANGGTSPYEYQWSDSQTTQVASGLCEGVYTVTATDANGCSASAFGTVVEEPQLVIMLVKSKKPTCYGFKDGRLIVKATGGSGNYTYLWSDANFTLNDTLDSIGSGNYCVIITDDRGCTATRCFFLDQPKQLILQFDTSHATCGMSNGNAVVSVLGNPFNVGLTFQWSNGDMDPFNFNIPAGIYHVTVTDLFGCSVTDSIMVDENCLKLNPSIITPDGGDDLELKAYPNPFSGKSNVLIRSPEGSLVTLELYDLNGQLIKSIYSEEVDQNNKLIEIDGQDLPNGVYLLNARNDRGEIKNIKLILSR